MLLRAIFILALLTIVGETIVHGAGALAATALHHRALDAARTALVSGVRTAQSSVAETIAANPSATAFPVPAPTATCAYADGGGCELLVATSFASASATATPAACAQNGCTVMLQRNSAVSEARASFTIVTTVSAPGGAQLAARSGVAAFRTFALPPYASLVGGVDASVDALMNAGAADDAGSASSLITVQYAPAGGGAESSGNVWQPLDESGSTAAPPWDP